MSCYHNRYAGNNMGNICLLFTSSPNRGGCSQGCQNTIGSYSCYCGTGYTLNSDEKSCDNINECLTTHNCYSKEFCTDTDGFYTCSCPEHFILKVTSELICDYIL